MISPELKQTILTVLKLESWDIDEATQARHVPGWDSLSHISIIVAVEKRFRIRFTRVEILRLTSVGDLQKMVDLKSPGGCP